MTPIERYKFQNNMKTKLIVGDKNKTEEQKQQEAIDNYIIHTQELREILQEKIEEENFKHDLTEEIEKIIKNSLK